MNGPSSSPRPEHSPRPGVTWERQLVTTGEIVVDTDRGESPFGWSDLPTTVPGMNEPAPLRPNRATRRAAARAARRKNQ